MARKAKTSAIPKDGWMNELRAAEYANIKRHRLRRMRVNGAVSFRIIPGSGQIEYHRDEIDRVLADAVILAGKVRGRPRNDGKPNQRRKSLQPAA